MASVSALATVWAAMEIFTRNSPLVFRFNRFLSSVARTSHHRLSLSGISVKAGLCLRDYVFNLLDHGLLLPLVTLFFVEAGHNFGDFFFLN